MCWKAEHELTNADIGDDVPIKKQNCTNITILSSISCPVKNICFKQKVNCDLLLINKNEIGICNE